MTFLALATLKVKKNGDAQQIEPGQIFKIGDEKLAVIDKLIKEGKGRAIKDFCLQCDLFERNEAECSHEKLLSFDKKCIGPYEYKEREGRLTLKCSIRCLTTRRPGAAVRY